MQRQDPMCQPELDILWLPAIPHARGHSPFLTSFGDQDSWVREHYRKTKLVNKTVAYVKGWNVHKSVIF